MHTYIYIWIYVYHVTIISVMTMMMVMTVILCFCKCVSVYDFINTVCRRNLYLSLSWYIHSLYTTVHILIRTQILNTLLLNRCTTYLQTLIQVLQILVFMCLFAYYIHAHTYTYVCVYTYIYTYMEMHSSIFHTNAMALRK